MAGEANVWNPRTLLSLSADTKRVEERLTAVDGQTLFTLTEFTYALNTGSLAVYKNGHLLTKGVEWTEGTDTTFSIVSPSVSGDQIVAVGFVAITADVDVRDTDIFVSNYQAVRDYVGTEVTLYAQGKTLAGDSGEAFFQKKTGAAPGFYVDNNRTVLVPTAGDGSIGWIRVASKGTFLSLTELLNDVSSPDVAIVLHFADGVKTPDSFSVYYSDGTTGTASTTNFANSKIFNKQGAGYKLVNTRRRPEQFGAVGDDTTDNTAFLSGTFYDADSTIELGIGKFKMGLFNEGQNIVGAGSGTELKPVNISTNEGFALALGVHTTPHGDWDWRYISDLSITADGVAGGGCIRFDTATATDEELLGRYVLKNLSLKASGGTCVEKEFGNIGNFYEHVAFHGADFHYHAISATGAVPQHTGADVFNGCRMQRADLASVYINDSQDGYGMHVFNQSLFEQNNGFGIFVKSTGGIAPHVPMTLNQVWFERNALAATPTPPATVTIDSVVYTPREIYLEDAKNVIINGSYIKDVELINTDLLLRDCRIDSSSGTYSVIKDDDSTIQLWNPSGDNMAIVDEWSHTAPTAIAPYQTAKSPSLRMFHRFVRAAATARTVSSHGFEKTVNYSWTGTATTNSTPVADGLIYDQCTQLSSIPANYTLWNDIASATVPSGKWVVVTLATKVTNGRDNITDVQIWDSNGSNRIAPVRLGVLQEWVTTVQMVDMRAAAAIPNMTIQIRTNSGGISSIRFADYQMVAFDTKQEAVDFIHSGIFEYTP